MNEDTPGWMAPASVVLAVAAVALSGVGGLMEQDRVRLLFGGLAVFCLAMLGVFMVMAGDRASHEEQGGLYAGLGALAGLCRDLAAADGFSLSGLVLHMLGGAVLSFVVYWGWVLRRASFWRE
jgi:hypothetical protein